MDSITTFMYLFLLPLDFTFKKITSNMWHNTDDFKQKYIFKLSFPPPTQQTHQGCNCMSYRKIIEISNLHVFSQINSSLN